MPGVEFAPARSSVCPVEFQSVSQGPLAAPAELYDLHRQELGDANFVPAFAASKKARAMLFALSASGGK